MNSNSVGVAVSLLYSAGPVYCLIVIIWFAAVTLIFAAVPESSPLISNKVYVWLVKPKKAGILLQRTANSFFLFFFKELLVFQCDLKLHDLLIHFTCSYWFGHLNNCLKR